MYNYYHFYCVLDYLPPDSLSSRTLLMLAPALEESNGPQSCACATGFTGPI